MKKTGIVLAIVFALILAGLAAGGFVLKNRIEECALESLKTAIGPDAETAVGEISFSFLDRTVTAKDWRSRRDLPEGPVSIQASEVKAVLAPRAALASIPSIGSQLYKGTDVVPVFDRFTFYGLKGASGPVSFESEAAQADRVRMTYDLLKKRFAGVEPYPLENAEGTWTDQISVRRLRFLTPDGNLSSRELKLSGIHGLALDRIAMDSVEVTADGSTVFACREFSTEKISVSASLYRKIQELSSSKDPGLAELLGLLAEFKKSGPLVSRLKLDGLQMPADADCLVETEEIAFDWKSVDPLNLELHLRGLKVPAKLATKNGVTLRGLDSVEIDADLSSSGLATSRQQGFVRIRNLFELQYDATYIAPSSAVKDVHLQLKDYALLAQAAVNVTPDGMAAAMMLKAGAQAMCLGDPVDRKGQCAKLAEFIDAPGTITLDTPKGLAIPTDKIAQDLSSGRFGSLFTVRVQPGGRTLDQLIRELPR